MSVSVRPPVCVVDDDAGIRESLRFLFEESDYEVEEAENGEKALALLRADVRPRVMLLDRMMPCMDGVQTLRRLGAEPRELLERTEILFMTARNDPPGQEIAELIQRYTAATVTKPFNLDTLLAAVEGASTRLMERSAAEYSTVTSMNEV